MNLEFFGSAVVSSKLFRNVGIGFDSKSEISPYLQHKLNTGLDVFSTHPPVLHTTYMHGGANE